VPNRKAYRRSIHERGEIPGRMPRRRTRPIHCPYALGRKPAVKHTRKPTRPRLETDAHGPNGMSRQFRVSLAGNRIVKPNDWPGIT